MPAASSRSDSIYSSLRRAILEQAMRPGMKLPEDLIAETFGVSRTSARTALMKLAYDGLVDIKPNRGASIATPTLEEAHEVFALRRTLEREVIDRLCKRMSKDAIDAMMSLIHEEERALKASSPRSIRLAGEFHVLLASQTNSPLLADFVNATVARTSLILARYGRPHSAECGIDEHIQLIEALKRQDRQGAIEIMDRHLHAVEDRAYSEPEDPQDLADILHHYMDDADQP